MIIDFGGFKASKLKPQLKMAVSRFSIASNKKSAKMKQTMREVAVLLAEEPPKEEKARIKAEALIRDDNMIEAYDILQLECELLSERIKLLESQKGCPPDLVSTISDLIYACPRVDIPELGQIRKQFRSKYGKDFEQAALENRGGVLNERVVSKLSVQPPVAYLVQTYLEKIAEQFEVDWQPVIKLSTEQMIEPMAAPIGFSVAAAQGTGLGSGAQAMTGTENIDEEINFQKGNGIPPADFGSSSGPVVNATAYAPRESGSGSSDNLPSVTPTTYIPGEGDASVSQATDHYGGEKSADNNSAYEEVDIFVPQAPSAPPTSSPGFNGSKKDDDDDDNDDNDSKPPAASGNTKASGSYEDLAARFEKLGK